MTNRSEINRSLAKALAFAECGKTLMAEEWGRKLLYQLEVAGVFPSGTFVDVGGAVHSSPRGWGEIEAGGEE